jgi:hypothetical protein
MCSPFTTKRSPTANDQLQQTAKPLIRTKRLAFYLAKAYAAINSVSRSS